VLPDLDISRTVGWFTSLYPVVLNLPETDDPGECLVAVRDDLRQIPNRGIGYGMARYLRPDNGRPWRSGGDSPLLFNYHGQIVDAGDRHPQRLRADCGPEIDPGVKRHYLIEVTAAVVEGCLQTWWSYPTTAYDTATVQVLAGTFIEHLRAIALHCGHGTDPDAGDSRMMPRQQHFAGR
jgi:non-ribosomal peptide synthase protein (TIGR01720 family)